METEESPWEMNWTTVTVSGSVHLTFRACRFVMLRGDFLSLKNVSEYVMSRE
ncbi:hypothetical protein AB0J21_05130 [Streptomyces sp. NPDC049954]|uniref:hypothetical protein n=1 Tax=Streptomyces sp. NPDC049954 TaxID=3155779 RepID=UPI0034182C75